MRNRKSFDWYAMRQRFSFRKYHFGLASVFLGIVLSQGAGVAHAEETASSSNDSEASNQVVTEETQSTEGTTDSQPLYSPPLLGSIRETHLENTTEEVKSEVKSEEVSKEEETEAVKESAATSVVTNEKAAEKVEAPQEAVVSVTPVTTVSTVAVAAPTPVPQEATAEADHQVELLDDIEKLIIHTVSVEELRKMSPAEIYALTRHELSGFNMTKEIFESLTEDQIRALTFNRDYQAVARANNQDLQSGFRVDTGSQSGYTVTPPMNTKYPNDPVAGRFTHTVVQSGDYYFTLSAEKPVLSGDELEKRVSDVYITAFDKNHRQLGEAVHRSTQTSGGLIDAFLKYNNTRITVTTDGVSVEGDGGLKRVYAHSGNNDPDAVFGSLSISLPRYTKQVTRYLKASDRKTPVREDYYQEGWEYSDYTTQPVTPIEFEGKTYTWDQVLPPNQNGKTGKLGQPYYKGDVNYIRARATAYANGPFVTVYQKREYIDNNGTMLVTVYATPRDSSTNPSVPSAEEFFQNMDKYTVYTDKMYGFNNTTGANIVNDVNAFYAAHMTGSDISVAANLKEPIIQTVKKEESFRNRFPMTEGGINTTGNITLRNRWDESSAVIYYYNSTGSVYVTYKDVDGNVLKVPQGGAYVDRVTDTGNALPGTDYSTDDHKHNTIKTEDGKTYKLAPAGRYPVGVVDANNHLTSSDAVTGKVEEGVDKTATYIYQEVKGDVVVLYRVNGTNAPITGISSDGKTIGNITNTQTEEKTAWEGAVIDTAATSTGTNYSTTDNRPSKITTADGKVYKRVENRVGGTEEGKVVEGTTRIVYYYELAKGNVVVNYVDENGTVLQPPVSDETNADTGKAYDTSDNKPATITSNGKVYELVPAGNYPVGKVDANNHLESSDPTTGKVEEGTKNVTYVYRLKEEPKGSVVVHYKDTEGNTIKDSVNDETDKPVGEDYTTTD
ncbi:MucBP domain-containing protein, partial [Streptococcus sp. 10F2]